LQVGNLLFASIIGTNSLEIDSGDLVIDYGNITIYNNGNIITGWNITANNLTISSPNIYSNLYSKYKLLQSSINCNTFQPGAQTAINITLGDGLYNFLINTALNGKIDILSNSYFDVVCGGIYCSVYTTYLSTNGSWNIVSNNLSTNSNPQFLIKCQYNSIIIVLVLIYLIILIYIIKKLVK